MERGGLYSFERADKRLGFMDTPLILSDKMTLPCIYPWQEMFLQNLCPWLENWSGILFECRKRWDERRLCTCTACFFIYPILKTCRAPGQNASPPSAATGGGCLLNASLPQLPCTALHHRLSSQSLQLVVAFPQSVPETTLQGELSPSTAGCTGCQGRGEICVNGCWLVFQLTVAVLGVKGFRIDKKNNQHSCLNWAEEKYIFEHFKATPSKVQLQNVFWFYMKISCTAKVKEKLCFPPPN